MSQRNYPGAKWWKFDFHAHTRASTDFMQRCTEEEKSEVTPEFWLQKFMEKNIDCVAITDHNSGAWVDELKNALAKLESEDDKPSWYRAITLFPGVEISANDGVHLLAIFGKDKTKSDIDSLLDTVGYGGTKGDSDGVTTKSITEVIDVITGRGGIALPAHVDREKGLFEVIKGAKLAQILDNSNIHAMELCESTYKKPQLYFDKKVQWTELRGSDTHFNPSNRFGEFTWIKMDTPSIEGLKLALIDGLASVNRNMNDKPNQHAEFVIEVLSIDHAKYIGQAQVLICQFSPFLNTIIGGRGSGKSTLLEFMRFVLRRNNEIPESLQKESNKYFQVGDRDLLNANSKISLIYRKGDTRYRLNWSAQAERPSLEIDKEGWKTTEGEIKSLFPVYIYSQKQIFELAKEPHALIDIIDQDAFVDYENLQIQKNTLVSRYKIIKQKTLDLLEKISQKNKLQGELNDLNRQIAEIEKSGHKHILQNYRKRQQELTTIENLENDWQEMFDLLLNTQDTIAPANFNVQYFDEQIDVVSAINQSNNKWAQIKLKLKVLTQDAKSIVDDWKQEKETSVWMQQIRIETSQYQQLQTQFEQQGIDPKKYPTLLRQQSLIKKQLEHVESYSLQVKTLETEKLEVFIQIEANRKALTENRQNFLSEILAGNQSVHIKVKTFGESWHGIESRIREILQCPQRFVKDIEHLKTIYTENGGNNIQALKTRIEDIRTNRKDAKDKRFAEHLQQLPQESISDLILWFPKDDLEITFADQQRIEQGSPGQKTAALLAFILSYGEEPLLLDQPEDDLDNELIYDLIVKQIRATKSKRQIIIVTHNANIVVNGDAEMVLPLAVSNGQTKIPRAASIQNQEVRNKICDILEGGQYAFSQRYKRIHLEVE